MSWENPLVRLRGIGWPYAFSEFGQYSILHMNLPPGVTVKVPKTLDSQGMPGIKKVTFSRLEIKPGAKWPNVVQPAKTWEYCYALAGEFTVKGADGKTSVVKAGTPFTVPAGTKIPEVSNHGKQTAVDIFWEIEVE
jgi:quercetin dioxygenase-like cupin family protein